MQEIYHVNGKLKYKGNLKNNLQNGVGYSLHYNGNLEYKGTWVEGDIDSKGAEIFHFNGNLKYTGSVVRGKLQGQGT